MSFQEHRFALLCPWCRAQVSGRERSLMYTSRRSRSAVGLWTSRRLMQHSSKTRIVRIPGSFHGLSVRSGLEYLESQLNAFIIISLRKTKCILLPPSPSIDYIDLHISLHTFPQVKLSQRAWPLTKAMVIITVIKLHSLQRTKQLWGQVELLTIKLFQIGNLPFTSPETQSVPALTRVEERICKSH